MISSLKQKQLNLFDLNSTLQCLVAPSSTKHVTLQKGTATLSAQELVDHDFVAVILADVLSIDATGMG